MEFSTQSDASGDFTITFEPLPTETGVYTVGARHPIVPTAPVQDTFTLVGMLATPASQQISLAQGGSESVVYTLKNISSVPLSGVTAAVDGVPANMTVTPTVASSIEVGASAPLTLEVAATDASTPSATITVQVSSQEGASQTLTLQADVLLGSAGLSLSPSNLTVGVIPGEQTLFTLEITNIAGVTKTGFMPILPKIDWVSLVSPLEEMDLAPNETVPIVLQFLPPSDEPLTQTPLSTLLQLAYDGVTGTTIPFNVSVLDVAQGSLRIYVEDELTYLDEAKPRVAGAQVVVRDVETGAVLAETATSAAGEVTINNLPVGLVACGGAQHPTRIV